MPPDFLVLVAAVNGASTSINTIGWIYLFRYFTEITGSPEVPSPEARCTSHAAVLRAGARHFDKVEMAMKVFHSCLPVQYWAINRQFLSDLGDS